MNSTQVGIEILTSGERKKRQMHNDGLSYRPDIDGLRAIAVLSVFIFHLNGKWLPGGFVGVDIFFVISGYLITSILLKDCKGGRFSLVEFYQRRIARIFPAFFTVALITLAGTAKLYSTQDFASAGSSLAAALLSLANIKYMLQGNYFEISKDAQPFLHYWSLSVEEQFYFAFPLLLFLVYQHARTYLTLILSLFTIGSLIACIKLTQSNPIWAFYLLPTRAWELSAGSLLAVALAKNERPTLIIPNWFSILGAILIGCSLVLLQEGKNFPGWQAILPVAGTLAIILSNLSTNNFIKNWLSSPAIVKIGKMSYSLYLWHWPVFSLIDYRYFNFPIELRYLLKISISILLTVFTFKFIETPARNYINRSQYRNLSFAALALLLAICVPLGFSIRKNNYVNAELADVKKGGLIFPGKPGAQTLILMGDSNGSMYGKIVKEICTQTGINLTVISVAGGDSLPSLTGEGDELWLESLRIIRNSKPDYLVLANDWVNKLDGRPNRLSTALNAIRPYVGHVVLLNQPPILPYEASRSFIRDGGYLHFRELAETSEKRHKANDLLRSFQSRNVDVLDVSHYFETNSGEIRYLDENGRELYHDSTHLSGDGAEKVRPILMQAVRS